MIENIHVPIGLPNSVDSLKTFVEQDGSFSPGCGSFGVSFAFFSNGKVFNPVRTERTYLKAGCMIPVISWKAGALEISIIISQSEFLGGQSAACRIEIKNTGKPKVTGKFYIIIRPEGPAGYSINSLQKKGKAFIVNGHTGAIFLAAPDISGVSEIDNAIALSASGMSLEKIKANSKEGNCSGLAAYKIALGYKKIKTLEFVCPILAGRRASGHAWDKTAKWAQFDLSYPDSKTGTPQPDTDPRFYSKDSAKEITAGAEKMWTEINGGFNAELPDKRWNEALKAILCHAAMSMDEGAPDVSVVNYNVFNRDGVYTANIFQKYGNFELAEKAIDYFIKRPFNGRTEVEADNPGQVLWIMGQHWLYKRDREWLRARIHAVKDLTAMIKYYRTTKGPHYVKADSLKFGKSLPLDRQNEKPADKKQLLVPGACDGLHPEYTEAFDISGLRAAELLLRTNGDFQDALRCKELAESLMKKYDSKFGRSLAKGYGSFSVLWPCELYPFRFGNAFKAFKDVGGQNPESWRYFPLATAHQGLLSGNRKAGYLTIQAHLDHPQMKGWYVFDEGGKSGVGGWNNYRTKWDPSCSMPHGWAIAELWLLIRDALIYEDGDKLVLFSGVPRKWFTKKLRLVNFQTRFGKLNTCWTGKKLEVNGVSGCKIEMFR